MKRRWWLASVFLVAALNGQVRMVRADECADTYKCPTIEDDDERTVCVDNKIACYQKKIEESKNQQNTLSGELTYIDNRIAYQETQIEKTRLEIVKAGKEADILSARIENLSQSMERMARLLSELVITSYKTQKVSSLEMFLAHNSFRLAVNEKQRQKLASLQTSKVLFRSMQDKLDYDQQKQEREELQVQLEVKTQQLKKQQADLEAQKESKAILLAQTKHSEKEYQKKMEEARKEAESFKRFAQDAGGGSCLGAQPGEGSNGWYFSQRDPRWCKQLIGGSNMTVGEVGCYLTSVAMIFKKYGTSTSPSVIAANRNYFFASTALMTTPPSPSGYTYKRQDYFNRETLDNELNNGRPVIVHVRTNNGYGGHFIVLYEKSGDDYKMHDPWYGADLDFSSRYRTSMIDSMRLFVN